MSGCSGAVNAANKFVYFTVSGKPIHRRLKIVKRILITGLLSIGTLIAIVYSVYYFRFTITVFDSPSNLDTRTETIEVFYINWACDCADFIETKYYNGNLEYEAKEEDCIFIEPSESALAYYNIDYFNKVFRLTGHFYKDKGIPTSYEMKTVGEKPAKSRVFRYDKMEIITGTE